MSEPIRSQDDLRARRVSDRSAPVSTLRGAASDLHGPDRLSAAFDRWVDKRRDRGLDLRKGCVELDRFAPDIVHYQGTPWRHLPRMLPRRAVGGDDVFVDVGRGKRRIVLQAASRYPLRRVTGIELSPKLADIARENLARAPHHRRAREVEIVTAEAGRWEVPDDVTIVYMFHSFAGDTFDAALARLIESHDRRPRRVQLIYTCPLLHERVIASGRFTLVRQTAFRPREHPARQVKLYELTA